MNNFRQPVGKSKFTKKSGFTLIELLVVISIISLLVSILLPALASARQSAQAVTCLARMQQLGLANGMYRNDYNSFYPVDYIWANTFPAYGNEVYRYPLQVAPYLGMGNGTTYETSDMDLYDTNAKNKMMCPSNGWIPYDGVGGWAHIRTFVNTAGNYAIWNYDTPVQFGHGFWSTWLTYGGGTHDYRPKQHEPTQPSRFLLSAETSGDVNLGYVTGHLAGVQYYHPGDSTNMLFADGHATRIAEGTFYDLGYTYYTD